MFGLEYLYNLFKRTIQTYQKNSFKSGSFKNSNIFTVNLRDLLKNKYGFITIFKE